MKKLTLSKVLLLLSALSACCYVGLAAYKWGYLQSALDHRVAAFSAPPLVAALIEPLPVLAVAAAFVIAAATVWPKK